MTFACSSIGDGVEYSEFERPSVHIASATITRSINIAVSPPISITPFGRLPDGRKAELYSLVNANGVRTDITNFGAIVVRLFVPDRAGRLDDVVLGYNCVEDYVKASPYFGALVGRYCNRIAHGRFSIDGSTYSLVTNNYPNGVPCHLHGGKIGFDKVLWTAESALVGSVPRLVLRYLSQNGEEGYPGNLNVIVTYTLTNSNSLKIDYQAVTDKATPVNLTQHSYFNLKGEGCGDILDHQLTIHGAHITPVGAGLIPTGSIAAVAGTPFDFTTPHAIGERVNAEHEQLILGGGYDHNWVLDNQRGLTTPVAEVFEPQTGRVMEVSTEEPGLQFYSGNFLNGSNIGKSSRTYLHRHGFCLEAQHYPDSPNQPAFPNVILRPGVIYQTSTVFKFLTR